jgi:hypothetical protein
MVADHTFDEALAVFKLFGEYGALWITDRIRTFSLTGNRTPVRKYVKIAAIYRKLMNHVANGSMSDCAGVLLGI